MHVPDVILDVGAYDGEFTQRPLGKIAPSIQYHMTPAESGGPLSTADMCLTLMSNVAASLAQSFITWTPPAGASTFANTSAVVGAGTGASAELSE